MTYLLIKTKVNMLPSLDNGTSHRRVTRRMVEPSWSLEQLQLLILMWAAGCSTCPGAKQEGSGTNTLSADMRRIVGRLMTSFQGGWRSFVGRRTFVASGLGWFRT